MRHIRDRKQWQRYLKAQYGRYWKVHFAKKTRGAWYSVKYLGRYLKRPPVSASKLRHYSRGTVVHHYYDHQTQRHRQQTLTQEDMIEPLYQPRAINGMKRASSHGQALLKKTIEIPNHRAIEHSG